MLGQLWNLLFRTVQRQLIVGITLTVAATMSLFIWDVTTRQQSVELEQQYEQAEALVQSVASSSSIWVASRDFSGLQEIVQGVAHYPDLLHAIVLDRDGQILAHSDASRVGQYLADLPTQPQLIVLQRSARLVDVIGPVMLGDRHIGWVRVGLDSGTFNTHLERMLQGGLLYGLGAITLSIFIAVLMGRYLTRRLNRIQKVADAVMAGSSTERADVPGTDEAAFLARQFNRMLDTLAQRERTVKESSALFRAVFENVAVGIAQVTPSGHFVQINAEFCRIIGYSRDEVISQGFSFQQITFAADLEADLAMVNRLLRGEADNYSLEKRYIRKDASLVWVGLSVQLLRDEEGQPLYFISAVQDISERKRDEAEIRIAATAFDSHEGMAITNAERHILRVNKAFTEITGYSAQDVIGQTPRMLSSGRHDAGFYAAMWDSIGRTGKWQGEIWNRRKCGEVFPEWLTITAVKDQSGQTTHYVSTFSDISTRKTAEDQIKNLAFYDPLTGLPNRRLLLDRLEQALATGARHLRRGALLFVDLDNFKAINDTLGHFQGDQLLSQVAKRLSACIREGDTVARLGGDEFVVMLEDLSEDEMEAATQAETVGLKALAALNRAYQLNNLEHHSTASIGITLFGGAQQEPIDEPLKRADLAMYQAKAAGRNTFRFYDPQMQAVVMARASLETALHEALDKQQFVLYYQPQISGLGQMTGVEALLRWQHPQRGMVPPGEFIALAEDTGLILPLGQWVMDTACAQLASWASHPHLAQLTIAVNVSAWQFREANFVQQVLTTLERTGADPNRLKLELTESSLVLNVEDIIAKMTALKLKGVSFSLDDFGTGYSSLSYLKRLPLSQLKIDQSFVRDIMIDPNDAAIAKMVIVLAESLGLAVIAEGVETQAQRDFLASEGCHAYQGYLFSRPLPLAQLEAFAARSLT